MPKTFFFNLPSADESTATQIIYYAVGEKTINASGAYRKSHQDYYTLQMREDAAGAFCNSDSFKIFTKESAALSYADSKTSKTVSKNAFDEKEYVNRPPICLVKLRKDSILRFDQNGCRIVSKGDIAIVTGFLITSGYQIDLKSDNAIINKDDNNNNNNEDDNQSSPPKESPLPALSKNTGEVEQEHEGMTATSTYQRSATYPNSMSAFFTNVPETLPTFTKQTTSNDIITGLLFALFKFECENAWQKNEPAPNIYEVAASFWMAVQEKQRTKQEEGQIPIVTQVVSAETQNRM